MAFLISGDIILDAVLTDTGRFVSPRATEASRLQNSL